MNKCIQVRNLVIGAATLFISSHSMAMVESNSISPSLEKNLIEVCEALKSNKPLKLKRAIKNSGVNKRAIANKLMCNGMSPTEFAYSNNAEQSALFLAKYMSTERVHLAQQK